MSRIGSHKASVSASGFTLVEIMVATGLSAIIFAGILSAYLFLGRNLTRLVNTQEQGVASRRALQWFTTDLSAAIQILTTTTTPSTTTPPSSSQIAITKPPRSATATSDIVTYVYNSSSGTLVRTETIVDPAATPSTSTTTTSLLSHLTAFTMNYYDAGANTVTPTSLVVKAVECTFTSATGTATSGTLASYQMVSPRVVVRNKLALK
jgi:type II secretory pathway component PulJ